MADEQLHHLGLSLSGRPHQSRLTTPALAGVDVRVMCDEKLRGVYVIRAGNSHQRRLSMRIGRLHIGPGLQQQGQNGSVATLGSLRHRRRTVLIGGLDVGARFDQVRNQVCVAVVDRPMQRSGAIGHVRVNVGVLRQRGDSNLTMAGPDCVDEGLRARRGLGRQPHAPHCAHDGAK